MSGDLIASARAYTELGSAERRLHHFDAAILHYERALAVYRGLADALKVAHTIRHLGDIHRECGHMQLAQHCHVEALEIYRGHPRTPPLDFANAIRGMALLKGNTGSREEAILLWQEARAIYARLNVKEGVAESDRQIAALSAA